MSFIEIQETQAENFIEIRQVGAPATLEELKQSIERGVLPTKFCYPGVGGDQWHVLRHHRDYQLGKRELAALGRILPRACQITAHSQPANLVHLGPGDGIEISHIIESCHTTPRDLYVGVDISREMLVQAERSNHRVLNEIETRWYNTDIEFRGNLAEVCHELRSDSWDRHVLFLVGHGVLYAGGDVMKNAYEAMGLEDYLVLTIEGDCPEKRQEIVRTYELPELLELLSVGLRKAGISPELGTYQVRFDEETSTVQVHFNSPKVQNLSCLTSFKPTEVLLRESVGGFGFEPIDLVFYDDVHMLAAVCRKIA